MIIRKFEFTVVALYAVVFEPRIFVLRYVVDTSSCLARFVGRVRLRICRLAGLDRYNVVFGR